MHGIAFHARPELHYPFITHFLDQPLQYVPTQILVGHFPSAEPQAGFYLVAFSQKTQHVVPFGYIIMLVHVDAEFDFFQDDLLLILLGCPLLLFLFVQEFAVIHDSANRRNSIWGNLYQVKIDLAGLSERFIRRQDSKLIPLRVNHAYLARADALIHANKPLIYAILLKTSQSVVKT